jgi:hypothetical protein
MPKWTQKKQHLQLVLGLLPQLLLQLVLVLHLHLPHRPIWELLQQTLNKVPFHLSHRIATRKKLEKQKCEQKQFE